MTSPRRKKREQKVAIKKRFLAWYKHVQNRMLNLAHRKEAAKREIDSSQPILAKMTNWQKHQWRKACKADPNMARTEHLKRFAEMEKPARRETA